MEQKNVVPEIFNAGSENCFESNITSSFQLSGAFTTGDYLFNSTPVATVTRDNSQEMLAEDKVIYLKNYKIGGMPQTATSFGFKYNAPKYWYAGINYNYFANIYLSPNPDRRTTEAIAGYTSSHEQFDEILDQTILENGSAVNLFCGKSWKIYKNNSYLNIYLLIS